jgi:hypothetical protein
MIPVEQIAALAELYDRYENALDPLSPECGQAKRHFDEVTATLHTAHGPDVRFSDFRFELVRQCREYLRKNRPT